MCGLIARCAALIVMIHGFRVLGRLAGPRWSGLALGLPSTTAIVLIFCGCEHGSGAATRMAEGSLLGLVAALALPLAYAQAVRRGWPLPAVLAAAVAAYIGVASALAAFPQIGAVERLGIAGVALVFAAYWARRILVPAPRFGRNFVPPSTWRTMVLRTAIPALYVLFLAGVEQLAGTVWAGLMSTFPSMSLVVLLVTYLEAGPTQSTRIALVLPAGNTSTAAFLAAFRLACPQVGLGAGMLAGYAAALFALLIIEAIARRPDFFEPRAWAPIFRWPPRSIPLPLPTQLGPRPAILRMHSSAPGRSAAGVLVRRRMHQRGGFSPLFETLAW
jgi:hypothetical protein